MKKLGDSIFKMHGLNRMALIRILIDLGLVIETPIPMS